MATKHGSNPGSSDVNEDNPILLGENSGSLYGLKIDVEPTEYVHQAAFIRVATTLCVISDDTITYDLICMANLVTTEGEEASPEERSLLGGSRVESIHYTDIDSQGRRRGDAAFTRLFVCTPGRYRLRIALMRMTGEGMSTIDTVLTRWFEVGEEIRGQQPSGTQPPQAVG